MMTTNFQNKLCLLHILFISFFLHAQQSITNTCERRELIVALYPIPDAENFYSKLEKYFEAKNPNVNLIINIPSDYYDLENGISSMKVDVYELDCILLKDFIDQKKILALANKDFSLDIEDFMPAAKIVYSDSKLYGVPHWLCANFLFTNSKDNGMRSINNLSALEKEIGNNPKLKSGLLIDLKGKLTLGELYADALFDEYKKIEEVEKRFKLPLDKISLENINRLTSLTYSNWGRVDSFHNEKVGFYQRQFGKGNGRALVGYSESLYYILDEIINGSYTGESNLNPDNIIISEFAISDKGSEPVGWVDALSIGSDVTGQKFIDAKEFINCLISIQMYEQALNPDFGHAPRYLLPAYKSVFSKQIKDGKTPYYNQLYPLVSRINSFTGSGFMQNTRALGKEIDLKLNEY